MNACPDQVGIETFRMLRDEEDQHGQRIQIIYEELKKGNLSADACRYIEIDTPDRKSILLKIAEQHGKMPKACLDDVVAIETGMQLENKSIQFFEGRLEKATDAVEREFLSRIIAEEREHYVLLADLKYYYTDPEAWFMEKSRARLDGAGGAA
jgi:rubrerythrin